MASPSCDFIQTQHLMGRIRQPQGLGVGSATSNQPHAVHMTPVNYCQKRLWEGGVPLQWQRKRRLQIQTPTKSRRWQNLGLCVHSVSWHTSFMLSAIMYMQFGCLGHPMGLPHKQYVSFGYCMPLDAYWHQQGRVGTSPTKTVLPTCPQRPIHMWNHKTAASWANTILDAWACTTAELLDRKEAKIWWYAGW
jgi:hypothetical protein